MIFVILGTQRFQMDRLLKKIDELVSNGAITAPVTAQTGLSGYVPLHYTHHGFLEKNAFDNLITESELIITHGGVSIIIRALRQKIPFVVCPRLAKYGEHVDDHQTEIAHAFKKKGFVVCYDDGDDLLEKINIARNTIFPEYISKTNI